ncbi:MAG: hypothetical protein CH104c_0593 [Candidatus Woesebacteria bacterium]|nr:MAG: hypothetical protein CH104c_0593 [Candidatus Woesebacteria bacterium]
MNFAFYLLLEFLLPFTPACISYAESIAGRSCLLPIIILAS